MNNPPSLFAMSNEPFANGFTIWLCIPGIDNGAAVYLEALVRRESLPEAEALAEKIHELLQKVVPLKETRVE